jgi:hypothetical protein
VNKLSRVHEGLEALSKPQDTSAPAQRAAHPRKNFWETNGRNVRCCNLL